MRISDWSSDVCSSDLVSNLVKSLILEVVDFPGLYDVDGREGRIIALLLDEVGRMPNAPYQVSMPSNPRLLRVCNAIIADTSDPRDIDDWAALAAMGRRTVTRSLQQRGRANVGNHVP